MPASTQSPLDFLKDTTTMTQALWSPSAERIQNALLTQFMSGISEKTGAQLNDYDDIWQWSIDQPEQFWESLWHFCGVIGEATGPAVHHAAKLMDSSIYPNATLNYAENLLQGMKQGQASIVFYTENGDRREVSYQQLADQVSQLQQALQDLGVSKGDRVAGYFPNMPEATAAMLATASLGAVWSSCSPDYGLNGLSDRFGQIEPKVLFTADGYQYNGKTFDSLATAAELSALIPSIKQVIVVPLVNEQPNLDAFEGSAALLDDVCSAYKTKPVAYTPGNFRDPLFILFSSGTTGLPKCIVHTVGGSLLQHLKEHQLQCDMRPGDRLLYFTTCGWAMWNWQVSALASGVTLVLYEGSPFYPDGYCLANIVEAEKLTHFGTSAKYFDACAKTDIRPKDSHNFDNLRVVLSTGSPLSEEGFRYVYDAWKDDICLSSISGGTDIIGCFVGGNPIGPVYAGQCQKRQLGMDVHVYDGDSNTLVGEPGELICLAPHPTMPLCFWQDPEFKRYHDAYFATFDNVWCHGDWVELTAEGGMVFHGRSDATLNPGGVRIGTAEIYRQIEDINEILEAVVIGQNWDNDVRVILFVLLRDGAELTQELKGRIKTSIRLNATPRHMPAKIIAVPDIPRTRSGKITELAVRDTVHGRPIKNSESLANPQALEFFKHITELSE